MTTNEKVARRKLSLLELAKELNNVSKACKLIGYSRQQFYEIRRNYQTYGAEGLLDKLPGCKGAHPNRVAPEIEQAILDYSLTRPTHGPLRVAQELALQGINVSAGGVRGVWQRHDLLSKHDRLLRLEKTHREQTIELNDEQIRLLERFSPEFRERQIEVHYTGELVAVDTFFIGALKGVGKVYLQTVLDCYSRHAWGRLYTSKLPVTSVHVLNETVLRSSKPMRLGSIPSCRTTGASSVGALTIIPTSCSCNWRGLSTGPPRYAGRRATALSSGYIAPCWMNTSVSRGGRSGMNQWSRCRQTWTAIWITTTPSGHIRAG